MTTTATNSPMIDYLRGCAQGKDTHDFWVDDNNKIPDLHAAREFANKIKAQNHENVHVEQRNNRVYVSIIEHNEVDIWPSV